MKTKNKMIVMVEIAIVLCSVFLVATLPAAAITNYESRITNYEEAASEDDFVLGVYGNANEDDTIDMRDLTYVKLIFFGKKPETELSDAKYDGKVNPLDFIQIKLIIVGKEKELTVVDSADRTVTVKKPVDRVILLWVYEAQVIRMFRAQDKIVGVSSSIARQNIYYPELCKLPTVGSGFSPDFEAILSLNPDLVIIYNVKAAEYAKKLPGIPVVGFDFWVPGVMTEEVVKLGYIFDKGDEAKHYIDDFHDKYIDLIKARIDLIKARTEGLSEEERPKVYVERFKAYRTYGGTSPYARASYVQETINIAGGENIFADLKGEMFFVDAEEVVVRNPDIIIKYISDNQGNAGYRLDDPSKTKEVRDEIMSRPELANVNAVKNGEVYLIDMGLNTGPGQPIAIAYWAKWLHPDLFVDLDPQAIHQEYVTEFQGLDFDVSERGVFVYHPELYPDGR